MVVFWIGKLIRKAVRGVRGIGVSVVITDICGTESTEAKF